MASSWRRWCGLCGQIPLDGCTHSELRQQKDVSDLVFKLFSISVSSRIPVCSSCLDHIQFIQDFCATVQSVQEMLTVIRKKKQISQKEIKEIREKFLAEKEEEEEEEAEEEEEEVQVIEEQPEEVEEILDTSQEEEIGPPIVVMVDETLETIEDQVVEDNEEPECQEEEIVSEYEEIPVPASKRRRKEPESHLISNKTQVEKIRCKYCARKFRLESYLRAHERMHENQLPGQLPYSCEFCFKRFASMSQLMTHNLVHTTETPYSCEHCGKSFKNNNRLRAHLEIHMEGKVICPVCGLGLNSTHSYHKHKFTHSEERRYKCPVCPKDFRKGTALKEHLISHAGLRPYSCPFCDKTFVNGPSVRLHKVKQHPKELKELEESGRSEEVLAKHRNLPTMEELIKMATGKA